MLAGVSTVVAAHDGGKTHGCTFRKVPSQATTAGWWADLSMAGGNPPPNYYAASPLAAKLLDPFDGIFHGDAKTPEEKYLTTLGLTTPTAAMLGQYTLLDYLLYYPFVDGDAVGDVQAMNNTVPLPRYTDGDGVMVMAVIVAPTTGSGQFTFDYINQNGIAKTSPVQFCATTAASIATIATSQQGVAGSAGGPFLTLASGDTGVRSITSATFTVGNGGLISLVLVKPLADLAIREINTTAELPFINARPGLPRIYDGAYLNLIGNVAGSIAAGVLTGYATFIWSA
jgi:hypothetical protein